MVHRNIIYETDLLNTAEISGERRISLSLIFLYTIDFVQHKRKINKREEGGIKMPDNGKGKELRKHERRNYLGTVRYCLNPHSDGSVLIASGIDVSDSGMSMFCSYPLKRGQGRMALI